MRQRFSFKICAAILLLCGSSPVALAADLDVTDLVAKVGHADKDVRIEAIDNLTALGEEAESGVPALIEALRSEEREVTWHACRALGAIGPGASAAVGPLTRLLGDANPRVRAYAGFALGRIGKPATSAVDKLIENAFDDDEMVRRSSIRALQRIDPPQDKTLPLVVKILSEGDRSIIMPALRSLAQEGEAAVPRLRKALKNEQARYWACLALAEIGPEAAEAVPELQDVLTDEEPDVRMQALVALGEVGAAGEAAIPAILELIEKEPYQNVRYAAVFALGKIGSNDAAREVLEQAMRSDDEFLRTIGAWALARTNEGNKELVQRAVRMIVKAFKSEDVNVRRAAARAAVEFDVDPELVAPALVDALKDKDDTVVANAIDALASMGPKTLKHIDRALQDDELRHYAVRLIARLGPEAETAVPALIKIIQSPGSDVEDLEFVREAQFALSTIGPKARQAIPALVESLTSDNEEVRASASYALGKIGPAARSAVPALRRSLNSESMLVKLAGLRAMLEIQPDQRQLGVMAAPLLVKALSHERELVRAEAATALGELGELAKEAVPRLKELLRDDSEDVRTAAEEALQKLQ